MVAVWKTSGGERFQNYRALFTILDASVVTREWLTAIIAAQPLDASAPKAFVDWMKTGRYRPLEAERALMWRSKRQQLPTTKNGFETIRRIHAHFSSNPYELEKCAALLARYMDPNIVSIDVTRPWMDGGRDAVGHYRIGTDGDAIKVEFALEAKCYGISQGNGVAHSSRLISRLRHRQFKIFVTTSYLDDQAYQEIRLDIHPVIVMSSGDIVALLASKGVDTPEAVTEWLVRELPHVDALPAPNA